MLCLHYIENEWEFFLASEVTTLPKELPFRNPTIYSYILLTPLIKQNLPVVAISLDLFKAHSVIVPREIELRLIIHELSQSLPLASSQ
jgi:hypothetical protein